MKVYVITIKGHEHSEAAARRCIESGKKFGIPVHVHNAFSPKEVLLTIIPPWFNHIILNLSEIDAFKFILVGITDTVYSHVKLYGILQELF